MIEFAFSSHQFACKRIVDKVGLHTEEFCEFKLLIVFIGDYNQWLTGALNKGPSLNGKSPLRIAEDSVAPALPASEFANSKFLRRTFGVEESQLAGD